ncbi:hypothetical protein ACTHQ2_24915 [Bacillus subtilis]|uniref:hypothetical protein n=1 Tax=Bacillus subtilis TaxID=1423 RepID=UPI003F7B460B
MKTSVCPYCIAGDRYAADQVSWSFSASIRTTAAAANSPYPKYVIWKNQEFD